MNTKLWARSLVVAGALTGAVALAGCNRDVPEPTPPPPTPSVAAQSDARPARPVVSRVATMRSATPTLAEKAQGLLNPGADVNLAVQGFGSPQQFLAVVYAAKNVNVPFVVLKDKVVTKKMTLAQAISATSKYSVNANLEAARAESEARADLARKTGPQ